MMALAFVGILLGALFVYALMAGIFKLFWHAILDRWPRGEFDNDFNDDELLGWLWPFSVPIGLVYMITWPFAMRFAYRGALWVFETVIKLPSRITALRLRPRKIKTKLPKARIHKEAA